MEQGEITIPLPQTEMLIMSDIESTLREMKERRKALPDELWQRGGEHWDHKTVTSGTHFVADCGTHTQSEQIADFIAHAPTDIDFLLSLLSQKDVEIERLKDGLEEMKSQCDQLRSERDSK